MFITLAGDRSSPLPHPTPADRCPPELSGANLIASPDHNVRQLILHHRIETAPAILACAADGEQPMLAAASTGYSPASRAFSSACMPWNTSIPCNRRSSAWFCRASTASWFRRRLLERKATPSDFLISSNYIAPIKTSQALDLSRNSAMMESMDNRSLAWSLGAIKVR